MLTVQQARALVLQNLPTLFGDSSAALRKSSRRRYTGGGLGLHILYGTQVSVQHNYGNSRGQHDGPVTSSLPYPIAISLAAERLLARRHSLSADSHQANGS